MKNYSSEDKKLTFGDVIPSVFREYSLSIEHTLMQLPLLKCHMNLFL